MKPRRVLSVSSKANRDPVLIVDRAGDIGEHLAKLLTSEFMPVLLSGKKPSAELAKAVVYIPFQKKIPKIPENYFSQVFYIDSDDKYSRSLTAPLRTYAKNHNVTLNVLTSIFFSKLRNLDELRQSRQVKLFIAGDIFGEGYTLRSEVGQLLTAARNGRVSLANQGLTEYYPISTVETARILIQHISLSNTAENTFLLYPQHPLTGLSVVRSLSKFIPDLKVNLLNKKQGPQAKWLFSKGQYVEQKKFETQLKQILTEVPVGVQAKVNEKESKSLLPIFAALGFFVVIFFVLPIISLLGLSAAGATLTSLAIKSLGNNQTNEAQELAVQAKNAFELSETIASSLRPVANAFGRGKTLESYAEKMETAQTVDGIILSLAQAAEKFSNSQTESDKVTSEELFTDSLNQLTQGFLALRGLEAEGKIPSEYKLQLKPYEEAGNYFLTVRDSLPALLGYDKEKKYLLLFQNNNELRPGGGFIGSYGLMTIKQGEIKDITIHDVYDADGQLTAHIEPPLPLKKYMGVEHWYLRDSNFAVDFPENAARAAFFLKLETGEVVDGVIGVDTAFVTEMLKATGPIELSDFNETITTENFSEIVQSQIQDEFFPGSQKKKQILSAFYDKLFLTLTRGKNLPAAQLLGATLNSLREKHLMVALAKPSEQQPFTLANVSGSLWDGRKDEEGRINDFLGIIESNIGENKVNPYIERQISQNVELNGEGELVSLVKITYKNNSQGKKFGGEYKNYLRLVTPFFVEPTKVVINGNERVMLVSLTAEEEEERGRVSANALAVDRGEEKGKKTLGFLVEVPVGKTVEVEVEFRGQTGFDSSDAEVDYNLSVFKQAGRIADPYIFNFTAPKGYQVISSSGNVKTEQGSVSGYFLLREDTTIEVELGKR